jgi:hypothetical protein
MLKRLRSTWLAGGGAVLLALSMTGLVAAAGHPSDTTDPAVVSPTLLTFEDVNGDGIDDDCAASAVTEDADAAAAAFLVVDTNADGTISTTEAAHSDWVGGANCNHGGYVSWVAQSTDDACDEADESETAPVTTIVAACDEETEETEEAASPTVLTFEDVNGDGIDDDCAASAVTADPTAAAAAFLLVDANADGKISTTEAAHSEWVGGANCNHGGFVSWVAHNSDAGSDGAAAAKAAKDALKAKPDHAAKQDVKARHAHAVKANKSHGKGHGAK